MKRKTVAILVCTCLVLSACADNKKEVESDQTESYQMSNNLIYYNLEDENDYVAIPDVGCLKAIYYGPDISQKDKQELHQIAVEKGLKEYDVDLDTGSRRYDLRVTAIK